MFLSESGRNTYFFIQVIDPPVRILNLGRRHQVFRMLSTDLCSLPNPSAPTACRCSSTEALVGQLNFKAGATSLHIRTSLSSSNDGIWWFPGSQHAINGSDRAEVIDNSALNSPVSLLFCSSISTKLIIVSRRLGSGDCRPDIVGE